MVKYMNIIIKLVGYLLMNKLTQQQLRNNLETAVLHNFIININKKTLNVSEEMWNDRYLYFLNMILSHEVLPHGIKLQDLVDFALINDSKKINEYLEYLPGMNLPIEKNKVIDPSALQNHGWMLLMYDSSIDEYNRIVRVNSQYKLIFKELNFFTFSIRDKYMHIRSNTSNILDFDWTIISVESETESSNKNINLKDKKYIKYYIENYEDLSHSQEQYLTTMIDMLII